MPPIVTKPTSQIFEEAKKIVHENQEKLGACSLPHAFVLPIDRITGDVMSGPRLFCKWKCNKCGGVVGFESKHWYEMGMKHARK